MSQVTRLLPLCSIGLGLGLGLAWFGARSPQAPASTPTPASVSAAPSPSSTFTPLGSSHDSSEIAARNPLSAETSAAAPHQVSEAGSAPASTLSDEARSRLVAEMESAYTTYDPASLPRLAPHLKHADPEIRAFARDAIVQLGHADGVPLLRAASREARDPREAAALLEAAEFLELPPAPPAPAAPSGASAPTARQMVRAAPAASS